MELTYPQYKKLIKIIGQLMKYNEEWRSKEKFIDDKLDKKRINRNIEY